MFFSFFPVESRYCHFASWSY
uniref:Uncharacterized protein n=1 Tax=Arundo donax TaxID=35708 RepID=A0A0A8YP44_ARUDO